MNLIKFSNKTERFQQATSFSTIKSLFFNKKTYLILFLHLYCGLLSSTDSALKDVFSPETKEDYKKNKGNWVYSGNSDNHVDKINYMKSQGYNWEYGCGDVPLFKYITIKEALELNAVKYYTLLGDRIYRPSKNGRLYWDKADSELLKERIHGTEVLEIILMNNPNLFKEKQEAEKKRAERRQFFKHIWEDWFKIILENKKNLSLLLLGSILIIVVLPLIINNFFKALYSFIFARRPKIIRKGDTNIYTWFWNRWFFTQPNTHTLICDEELQYELESTIELQALKLKAGLPLAHTLLYGATGVGKSLFAKTIAKETNMNFIKFTVASLCQLQEEEAIEELKSIFALARSTSAPTMVIVEEFDRFFKGDLKSDKLALVFQQEFDSAIDSDIQCVFTTNYPGNILPAMLDRISQIIKFSKPDFDTQKELFTYYLNSSLKEVNKNKKKRILYNLDIDFQVESLSAELCMDLVGRDIEAISYDAILSQNSLCFAVASYVGRRKEISEFKMADRFKEAEPPKKTQGFFRVKN